MNPRPLQYESFKAVIKHMDPNFRFKLCLWLPSYRPFDRVVPLKMQRLEFKPYEFIVNETSYRLGTYRDYGESEAPAPHRRLNGMGGASSDFDQYGFEIAPADEVRTPGDFLISSGMTPPFGPQTDEAAQRTEAQLRVLQYVIARGRGEDVGPPPVDKNDRNYGLIAQYKNCSAETYQSIQAMIDSQLNGVLPFRYLRTRKLPPYKKFVRLNVSDRKSLADVLFGRRDLIDVEHLVVESDNFVIRLPPVIKFNVQRLTTGIDALTVCQGVESIITFTPLKVVNVARCLHNFNHRILNTAEELAFSTSNVEWIETFLTLRNAKISVARSRFQVAEYCMIVQDLLDTPRAVGTCMQFGLEDSDLGAKILETIEARFQGVRPAPRNVIISMTDRRRQIAVSYDSTPEPNQYRPQWTLVIQVEESLRDN